LEAGKFTVTPVIPGIQAGFHSKKNFFDVEQSGRKPGDCVVNRNGPEILKESGNKTLVPGSRIQDFPRIKSGEARTSFAAVTSRGFFALMWEFRSFFITPLGS